ncbi:hypothetical protein I316_03414 [Kwoniella heveanensis BCC8398]|uniref:Cytochrome b5 heme-binding domain-containing protein n=1 Tax=Kwoniella heveanensis BCC8398 TaxID=1296120 RepID=A0A1B9GV19_9TREE|nr:hypothetical protein I316_03414 [Kwoniella heveanensis BCC8398]
MSNRESATEPGAVSASASAPAPRQDEFDVYTNPADEIYPGARQRSRPGTAPKEEVYDTTVDAFGNRVSDKPANRGMLAAQRRRLEHEARLKTQQQDSEQKRRKTKASSPGPGRSTTTGNFSIWRYIPLILFIPLLSSFLTQSYTFNLSPYFLPAVRRYWDVSPLNPHRIRMREFTPLQLSRYDGRGEDEENPRPVYLAIDGVVYDVTANRRIYGKGGSYNMMAGRDASRAFTTGCFETHLTHDTRGLSDQELAALKHWKSFFANHEKYRKVGTVRNPPLGPNDPIPPPCKVAQPETESAPASQAKHVAHAHGQPHGGGVGESMSDGEHGQGHAQHAPGEAAAKKGKAKPGPVAESAR